METQQSWKWLWKLKLPYRILHILWLLRQRKILTNKACFKRGIRRDDLCKSCAHQEDENHIFRECRVAKRIWNAINPSYITKFDSENIEMRLENNLKHQESGDTNTAEWSSIFAATIWNIWKGRNDFQFGDCTFNHDQVVIKSQFLARDIMQAFHSNIDRINSTGTRLINWKFPNAGTYYKINTDGSLGQGEGQFWWLSSG